VGRYREAGYATFEDYCSKRFGFGRSYGHRLVVAAARVQSLAKALPGSQDEMSPVGNIPLPTAERQVRPLTGEKSGNPPASNLTESGYLAAKSGRAVLSGNRLFAYLLLIGLDATFDQPSAILRSARVAVELVSRSGTPRRVRLSLLAARSRPANSSSFLCGGGGGSDVLERCGRVLAPANPLRTTLVAQEA